MSAAGGSISGMGHNLGSNLGHMMENTASLARHLSHRASSLGMLPEEHPGDVAAAQATKAHLGAHGSGGGAADAMPSRGSLLVRRLSAAAANLARAAGSDGVALSKAGSVAADALAGIRLPPGQQQLSVNLQDAALATTQSGELDQGQQQGAGSGAEPGRGSRRTTGASDAGSTGPMVDIPITPSVKGLDAAGLLGSGLLTPQLSRKATIVVDAGFLEGLAGDDQGDGHGGLIGTEVEL
jgi:hypothetical protein